MFPCEISVSLFISSFQVLKRLQWGLYSLLQPEKPQISQPIFIGGMHHPSDYLHAFLWTWSNKSMSFLCWGPQNWMQFSRWGLTRVENPLSQPAGHTGFDAAQDAVGLLRCKHTHKLLHVQFFICQNPMPFSTGLLPMTLSLSIPMSGSAMTGVAAPWTCWTAWDSNRSTSQIFPGPSGWHPVLQLY